MRKLRATLAAGPDGEPQTAARGAVVLRDVAAGREPRLLPRPNLSPGPGSECGLRDSIGPRQPHAGRANAGASPQEAAADAARNAAASEEALRRGHEAGFALGMKEGRQQGLVEGREVGRQEVARAAQAAADAAAERLARLDALVSALPAELARRLEAAEDDMVALCHAAVCRILGDELVTPEAAAHAVRLGVLEALRGSPVRGGGGRAPIAIHVDPRALDSLRGDERLAAWLDQAGGVRWVADERVRAGGCIVSSSEGTLDARLETQMAALRRVLSQGRNASAPVARGSLNDG